MKQLLVIIAGIFFTISSFGQFSDTSELNAYIRDTIKDRRPEKVSAAQLQKALLGTTKFLTSYSFSNGLTTVGDSIKWGGVLTQPTTISSSAPANTIAITGNNTESDQPLFKVSSGGNGLALRAEAASGIAFAASTTSNTNAALGVSNGGTGGGIEISTSGGDAIAALSFGSGFVGAFAAGANNFGYSRFYSSGGSGLHQLFGLWKTSTSISNGFGAYINLGLFSTAFVERDAARIAWRWTNATDASRTAALDFYTTNSGTIANRATLAGNGQWNWTGYGAGSMTGTPAFNLGVASDGSVIEVPTSVPTLKQITDAGNATNNAIVLQQGTGSNNNSLSLQNTFPVAGIGVVDVIPVEAANTGTVLRVFPKQSGFTGTGAEFKSGLDLFNSELTGDNNFEVLRFRSRGTNGYRIYADAAGSGQFRNITFGASTIIDAIRLSFTPATSISFLAGGPNSYTFPTTRASAGEVLTDVNGDGNLTWESPGRAFMSGELTSVANADIDLAAFSTQGFDRIEIQFDCQVATDDRVLFMRFSSNGTTFDAGATDYEWGNNVKITGNGTGSQSITSSLTGGAGEMRLTSGLGNNAAYTSRGTIKLYEPFESAYRVTYDGTLMSQATSGLIIKNDVFGQRKAAQQTLAVRFYLDSGNFSRFKYRVYGYKD